MLEALALRVPVVACENGTRRAGVITYPPTDAHRLAAAVEHVLDHRAAVVSSMPRLELSDFERAFSLSSCINQITRLRLTRSCWPSRSS